MSHPDRSRREIPEENVGELNDGSLTVSSGFGMLDPYDFGARAALVRAIKDERGLAEFEPLPSPRTVEIEPTLICNARCGFCSYEQDIARFRQESQLAALEGRKL